MKEYLSIDQISEYLSIKRSTLYSMVESGEIPHYRIGRLIRFKMSDVEAWMENHRQDPSDANKKAREILKAINKPIAGINRLVKKSIEKEKGKVYTLGQEKPGRIEGLKKEVGHGTV